MNTLKISKHDVKRVEKLVEEYQFVDTPLMEILHKVNELYGYIPLAAGKIIAHKLQVPLKDIITTATFYDFFYEEPLGKTVIRICEGASCVVNNSESLTNIIKNKLGIEKDHTTEDKLFSVEIVYCNGHCHESPTITVNDTLYTEVDVYKLGSIMREYYDES